MYEEEGDSHFIPFKEPKKNKIKITIARKKKKKTYTKEDSIKLLIHSFYYNCVIAIVNVRIKV